MRLSRALSDLVKYTKSVRVHEIETQGKGSSVRTSNLFDSKFVVKLKGSMMMFFSLSSGSIYKQLAGIIPQRDCYESDLAAKGG